MIKSSAIAEIDGISHGFFTRQGGHSRGIFASLNTGLGADEDNETILKNRQIVADKLGAEQLVTPYQYHSAVVLAVDEGWDWQSPPKADGLVTRQKGLAIAVNTADCTPVIFADVKGRAVGIAHAGWKGTVGGVLEAVVAAMAELGVEAGDIIAAIGPTISQENYEVGPEFVEQFIADNPDSARFFIPSKRDGHAMFDLPACVEARLQSCDLNQIEDLALCTYGDEEQFFSYRRATHRSEPDYGRQMSGVCLL